jgi:hypothetical protein
MVAQDENHALFAIPTSPHMEPANMEPASAKPEIEKPETKRLEFLLGLSLPLLVIFIIYSSGALSANTWDFNRRVEVVLHSDDDGVFRFSAEPETSHGRKESVSLIFLDTARTDMFIAYRPEIHIGPSWDPQTYNRNCDTEPANTVCMYFLKDVGGELEFTKIGEYDQFNHTAEFVLEGETDESIGVRIDYHNSAAEQHFYDVEQPRNEKLVFTIFSSAYVGALTFAAVSRRRSLASGLLSAAGVMVVIGAVWILVGILTIVSFIMGN